MRAEACVSVVSWTSVTCHLLLWKVWSAVPGELQRLLHVCSSFLRVSDGKKVNVFFMWPLECTQKRLFLSKSKRETRDLKNVHLTIYFSWSLSRSYLKLNSFKVFCSLLWNLSMNVVYIGILTSESHWKISAIIVSFAVLEFTGRCCDFLYYSLNQSEFYFSVMFFSLIYVLKEFNIVWIIVLKVFWNISHVISISFFPCLLCIHRKIEERVMNKPLSEWRKLRILYWWLLQWLSRNDLVQEEFFKKQLTDLSLKPSSSVGLNLSALCIHWHHLSIFLKKYLHLCFFQSLWFMWSETQTEYWDFLKLWLHLRIV